MFFLRGSGSMGSKAERSGLLRKGTSFSFLVAVFYSLLKVSTSFADRTSCVFVAGMSVLLMFVTWLRVTLLPISQDMLATLLRGEVLSFSILGMRSS